MVLLIGAGACSSGGLRLTGLSADEVLALAIQQAEEENWDQAVAAFQAFIFQYPSHPRHQEARFRLGQVYYDRGEHITAAGEFARLADDYPGGEYADDARFMVCDSYREVSPRPQLDQEYTRAALEHCQSLIAYYPDSEHAARAQEIITEMRDKLAMKLFYVGEYYYRRRAWDSAILSFNDVLEQFPQTAAAPRALLHLYRTYRELGYEQEAQDTRERLLREFPDSEQAREVRDATFAAR